MIGRIFFLCQKTMNSAFSRNSAVMLGATILALTNTTNVNAAVIGTSGTVLFESNPFPTANNNQIFVFDEQQNTSFVGTQSLDFGNIAPGTQVNSHYLQYEPLSETGIVGAGSVTFDAPILGVASSTANLSLDLNPDVAATADTYFGLESLLGPYALGLDPDARGIGSPEDNLTFTIGSPTLSIDSLEIPATGAGNLDGIRIFTAVPSVPEPITLLGTVMTFGLGLLLKRKHPTQR